MVQEQSYPLSEKTRNLVRFCRHPDYETMADDFVADYGFRARGSRFSILKDLRTAPGPDACHSFLQCDSRLLFRKLLGLEMSFPGLSDVAQEQIQLYNSMSYFRSHIEEIFYVNGIRPLPPFEGICQMFFRATDELSVVYRLRATSAVPVRLRLRWFSVPDPGLESHGEPIPGGFVFTNTQKVACCFSASARVTSSGSSLPFAVHGERWVSDWVDCELAPEGEEEFRFRIRFGDGGESPAEGGLAGSAGALQEAIETVENVYRRLPHLGTRFERFEDLQLKAAGTLLSLEFLDRDADGNDVLTCHSGKCGVAATWWWDTGIHLLGLGMTGERECGQGAVRLLCDGIRADGTPPLRYAHGTYTYGYQQPTLCWGTANLDADCPDQAFIASCYPALKRYVEHWCGFQSPADGGLVPYPPGGSCWDDALRWQVPFPVMFKEGEPWYQRDWGQMRTVDFYSVDTNTHLCLEFLALSRLAERIHASGDAAMWAARAAALAEAINSRLYNPVTGVYEDQHIASGSFTGMLTPACFMPVYAGIAPRDRAAQMCRRYLLDPEHFYTVMPFPSLDRQHAAFRPGGFLYEPPGHPGSLGQHSYIIGRTGLYLSYWMVAALWQAGLAKEADEAALRILRVADRSEAIHEYYDPLTGAPVGHAEFAWGATGVLGLTSGRYRRGPLGVGVPSADR